MSTPYTTPATATSDAAPTPQQPAAQPQAAPETTWTPPPAAAAGHHLAPVPAGPPHSENGWAASVDGQPVDIEIQDDQQPDPPATVRLGGTTFLVQPPDFDTVLEIENAGTTERVLSLLFDEQWPAAREILAPMHPDKMIDLVSQLGDRLGFSQRAMLERVDRRGAGANRATRRRRQRQLPR